MEEQAITVTQLSNYIKQIFDAEEMLFNIKVVGEISGLSVVRGVAYFTLKDENAQLSCVCFNADFSYNNGDKIVATGTPKYYVKGGKLNFNVIKVSKYGLGDLYQKFLELKKDLEEKGYFDDSRKKELPKNIKRIGVVTSREGAVIQDIINVRTRRNPFIDIVLYNVKVQGVNAEKEIAKAIFDFDNYSNVDLIIVARGGGSLEDLQPFNTKEVADAVFACNKFVLSAVGHETDFTICDFCSDLRAPTPSAAAELVCDNIEDRIEKFFDIKARLKNLMIDIYNDNQTYWVDLTKSLVGNFESCNTGKMNDFIQNVYKLKIAGERFVDKRSNSFEIVCSKLKKLDPNEILKLGYAHIRKNEQSITSVKNININDDIDVLLKDGIVKVVVKEVKGE